MDNLITSLGLMSGTSLDGIDASIILSDGEKKVEILDNKFTKYPDDFREKLTNYIKKINSIEDISENKKEYYKIEKELTLLHSKISSNIIKNKNYKIDLVGFHGQTIIHRPDAKTLKKISTGKKENKFGLTGKKFIELIKKYKNSRFGNIICLAV